MCSIQFGFGFSTALEVTPEQSSYHLLRNRDCDQKNEEVYERIYLEIDKIDRQDNHYLHAII